MKLGISSTSLFQVQDFLDADVRLQVRAWPISDAMKSSALGILVVQVSVVIFVDPSNSFHRFAWRVGTRPNGDTITVLQLVKIASFSQVANCSNYLFSVRFLAFR